MKNVFLILMVALIFPVNALAGDPRPYVSVGSGWTMPNDYTQDINQGRASATEGIDFDAGFKVGGAIGVESDAFRIEAEFTYREADIDKYFIEDIRVDNVSAVDDLEIAVGGKGSSKALMFNGFYKLGTFSFLSPYVGTGLGVTWEEIKGNEVQGRKVEEGKDKTDGFAFQFMAGITAPFTDNLVSDIEYRYFDGKELKAHEIGANLRYIF